MLSDEAEIYGAAWFYFIKVFSQFNEEEFWEYQAGKKTQHKDSTPHRDLLGKFQSYWALPCSKGQQTLRKNRPEHKLVAFHTCFSFKLFYFTSYYSLRSSSHICDVIVPAGEKNTGAK